MIAPPWLSRAQLRLSDDCGMMSSWLRSVASGVQVVVIGADAEHSSLLPFRSHFEFSSDSSGFDSLLIGRYCVRRCSQLRFFAPGASQAQRYARTDDITTYVWWSNTVFVYPCDVGADMTYDLPTHHSRVARLNDGGRNFRNDIFARSQSSRPIL